MVARCRHCGGWAATEKEYIAADRRKCRCKSPNLQFGPAPRRNDCCSPMNLFLSFGGLERNAEKKKSKNGKIKGEWAITVFGWHLTVNLNSVLTAVFGSIACTLAGLALAGVIHIYGLFKVMVADVPVLEKELHRLSVEYPPLVKPNFTASVLPSPVPGAAPTPDPIPDSTP